VRRTLLALAAAAAAAGTPVALAQSPLPAPPDPDAAPPLFRPAERAPLPDLDAPKFVDLNGSAPQAREETPLLFDPRERAEADAAAYEHPWAKRVAEARAYLRDRAGHVAFAVVDDTGTLRGLRGDVQYRSASLVKAMFLVAYLNRIPDRALTRGDRALLKPMIIRSDNDAATRVLAITGPGPVRGVARRAGMTRFALKERWGDTLVTAADQARFFARIDSLVTQRHRSYARSLLAAIVREQRWGVPPAVPDGWRVFFKGGWRPLGDRHLVNQAALLESPDRRASLAVLTVDNPSHEYGTETIRGVARRILRGLR
jgi:beta-lactamase class A